MLALGLAVLLIADLSVAERIARGKAALEALDYEEAADELMIAAAHPGATEDERVEANLYAGIANRVIGRDVDARVCFRYVLLRRPETRLDPALAPKVGAFFEVVRGELSAEKASAPAVVAPPPPAPVVVLPDPAPPPEPAFPWLLTSGAVIAGGSGCAAVSCGSCALAADSFAADPRADGDGRALMLIVGRVALVAIGVSIVGAAVGAGLMVAEP